MIISHNPMGLDRNISVNRVVVPGIRQPKENFFLFYQKTFEYCLQAKTVSQCFTRQTKVFRAFNEIFNDFFVQLRLLKAGL